MRGKSNSLCWSEFADFVSLEREVNNVLEELLTTWDFSGGPVVKCGGAVILDHDAVQNTGIGAAGADSGKVGLHVLDGLNHLLFINLSLGAHR